MLNLVSYTVPDYEARWIDVVVLERVAEIVAQEINAGTGIASVDAEALKGATTATLLGEGAADATALVVNEQTGQVAVVGTQISEESRDLLLEKMGTNAEAIDLVAHELVRRELAPVQESEMLASAAQADAEGGVSNLSATITAKVAAQLGVGSVATPLEAPSDTALVVTLPAAEPDEATLALATAINQASVLVVVDDPALQQVVAEGAQRAGQDQPASSVLQEVIQLSIQSVSLPAPTPAPEPEPQEAAKVPEGWRAVIRRVLVWVPVVRLYMRSESNDALPDAQGKAQSAYSPEEGADTAAQKSRLRLEWLRAEERAEEQAANAHEAFRPLGSGPIIH